MNSNSRTLHRDVLITGLFICLFVEEEKKRKTKKKNERKGKNERERERKV